MQQSEKGILRRFLLKEFCDMYAMLGHAIETRTMTTETTLLGEGGGDVLDGYILSTSI
jgi:hypothetical protein